jgi:hypothetical protein
VSLLGLGSGRRHRPFQKAEYKFAAVFQELFLRCGAGFPQWLIRKGGNALISEVTWSNAKTVDSEARQASQFFHSASLP